MNLRIKCNVFIFATALLFLPIRVSAQFADTLSIECGLPHLRAESWNAGKKIGLSFLESEAFNISLLHFSKYILKEDFAQVTFAHIKRNLKFGTGWDNDAVGINFVGHPAQGMAYHLINRLNGLSFWSSLPFTFINASLWEFFFETEPPSINDFVTTSWNGVMMGEAVWRIGNYAFCKPARKNVDFQLKAGIGARTVTELSHSMAHPKNSPAAGGGASAILDIVFGDRMHVRNNVPLNFFDIHLMASIGTGQSPIGEFEMLSRIWGRELEPSKGEAIFGIYDHLTSFLSESWTENRAPYRCAEAGSVGPGIIYSNGRFTAGAFVAGTVIGAATTDYYDVYDRDYSFGSGYSIKSLNTFKPSDKFSFDLNFRHFQLFTFWGDKPTDIEDRHYVNSTGDNGTTLTEIINLKAEFLPHEHVSVGFSTFYFLRNSFYKIHPSAKSSHLTAELCVKYVLDDRK